MEIPDDAVWFTHEEFKALLKEWLLDYEGVRYSTDLMDTAHGWAKK
jgi:hypothetical protein